MTYSAAAAAAARLHQFMPFSRNNWGKVITILLLPNFMAARESQNQNARSENSVENHSRFTTNESPTLFYISALPLYDRLSCVFKYLTELFCASKKACLFSCLVWFFRLAFPHHFLIPPSKMIFLKSISLLGSEILFLNRTPSPIFSHDSRANN